MVRWLILTRTNDHSGANLGGGFIINRPHGAVTTFHLTSKVRFYLAIIVDSQSPLFWSEPRDRNRGDRLAIDRCLPTKKA